MPPPDLTAGHRGGGGRGGVPGAEGDSQRGCRGSAEEARYPVPLLAPPSTLAPAGIVPPSQACSTISLLKQPL